MTWNWYRFWGEKMPTELHPWIAATWEPQGKIARKPIHGGRVIGDAVGICGSGGMQRSAIVGAPGLVNFTTAVAYHFCPSLLAAFTQPGAST